MSGNVVLTWGWPVKRSDGAVLDAATEIDSLSIEAKLRAAPDTAWGEIASVPYDAAAVSRRFPDFPAGDWQFRGTVLGTVEGDDSPPVTAELIVPKGAMGALTELTAALE